MPRAFVALGANIGQPRRQVMQAFEALAALPDTHLLQRSRLYRTPPWGLAEQPPFINAVAEIETALSPLALLRALRRVETAFGRDHDAQRWGPRTLDLDLLLYDDRVLREPDLTLPHPRMGERAFVLLPLADLAPQRRIPGQGVVRELLADVDVGGCEAIDDDAG